MSPEMRLIELAEAQEQGGQPPIALSWKDYKALIEARDQARDAAGICYQGVTRSYGAGDPGYLLSRLEHLFDVEDYTQFPLWLTGKE